MKSAVSGQLVREVAMQLNAYLAPLGFVFNRKANRFSLLNPARCIVIEVQKSSKSTASSAIVTTNIGIWYSTLAAKFGGPVSANGLSAMDCHWWLRAGQLDDVGQGRWWEVNKPHDIAVAGDIWASLLPAVALLTPLKDDAEFLAYLLTTQGPFLDPMNRWAFACVLAGAVGNLAAQLNAASELNRIGEIRTLPIAHKMLLQSVRTGANKLVVACQSK